MADPGRRPSVPAATAITGASGGIGRALALLSAERHGGVIALLGRDETALDEVAVGVAARGATPVIGPVDVRDRDGLTAFLTEFDDAHPVARLWANAGVSAGLPRQSVSEAPQDVERMVSVNLLGSIATVNALADRMRARGAGRIGLVSSIAALRPLPELATYGATKAGLVAFADAIRPVLARHGVSMSVLCPGFVTSAMSARHLGPRPFEIPAERAARIMDNALSAGRPRVVFPWQYAFLVGLARLAPAAIVDRVVARFSAEIAPDPKG